MPLETLKNDRTDFHQKSYITSILGFKISLLLSYLRFIPKGVYRWATLITIGMCIAYHIAFLVVQVNLCTPVRLIISNSLPPSFSPQPLTTPQIAKQWDPTITNGSCIPGVPFYTSMAALTIVFDIVV